MKSSSDIQNNINRGTVLCQNEVYWSFNHVEVKFTLMRLQEKHPFMPGFQCVMHSHNVCVPCEVTDIKKDIKRMKVGESCNVTLRLKYQIYVEPYKNSRKLGRVILRSEDITVGFGDVLVVRGN